MRPTIRVLVTGAGSGRANNLIRSLQANTHDFYVAGCHDDPFLLKKSNAVASFQAPKPSHPGFVEACRPVIEAKQIDLIIPSSDEDALALCKVANELPFRVFLPSAKV